MVMEIVLEAKIERPSYWLAGSQVVTMTIVSV